MQNTKVIFTKRLATYLKKLGFTLLRTEVNFKHPELYVFIFEYSDALTEAIKEYKIKYCDNYE